MFPAGIFGRALVIGLFLQLTLAIGGHFLTWLTVPMFLFARMMISAATGYLYGMYFGRGYSPCALGGSIAGGICVLPALGLSVLLGDADLSMLALGTGVSILTGGVGGLFGQMAANLRRMGY